MSRAWGALLSASLKPGDLHLGLSLQHGIFEYVAEAVAEVEKIVRLLPESPTASWVLVLPPCLISLPLKTLGCVN